MTASTLRHAAAAMREQNTPGRGYMDDTFLAVADWLENYASEIDEGSGIAGFGALAEDHLALAVANAYLLADAKADAL